MRKWAVAAVASIVLVMAAPGSPAVAQGQRFPDVPPDHDAFEAVEWAAGVEVTLGYPDGTFKPSLPLGRWHALVFMERYYGLDPFYAKHIDAALPVVGSSEVSDEALRRAALVFGQIVANRPDIVRVLAQDSVRIAVYAVTETIVDLPEVAATWPDLPPISVGLGPGSGFPVVAVQEANLLCHTYFSSLAVHEGGHAVDYALELLGDDAFQNRLDAAYENALVAGLWEGTYGATNAAEYWAEGVMWFMNAADERDFTYTWVNTRDELEDYDPVLYELVLDVLGDVEATASCWGKQ